jgi:uncharacterized coiled-coil DUF342 family protein
MTQVETPARSLKIMAEELMGLLEGSRAEQEEFERWKETKAKHLAEIATAKSEAERHRNARRDHQAAVDELKQEREKLRQEITGLLNDRARLRRQADELATWLKITKLQHRVE